MGMRITSPIESGAGSSGSMGGLGIDSAGAGLEEVVLMRGEFMVLHRPGGELTEAIHGTTASGGRNNSQLRLAIFFPNCIEQTLRQGDLACGGDDVRLPAERRL